jgi:UDP-GlcNAc:undecaprenyl-phosphate GlcNAc-1-phosphate transferase
MSWSPLYIVILGEAFLVSYFLTFPIIKLAKKFAVVDKPGHRKIHEAPKPLLGGVAIFTAFFSIVIGNLVAIDFASRHNCILSSLPQVMHVLPLITNVLPKLRIILAGGFFIHLLGLLDDIYKEKISYQLKFLVQAIVAFGVASAGIRTHFMPTEWLNVAVTTVWIIGITNGFNLLDNLDGLTAGISVISALIFYGIASVQGQVFFAFILLALAGAGLGFLIHNFHPSKLFMGDSGSLFLGYLFGTLTVMGSYVVKSSTSLMPVVMPLLILSIPLYDTFSVMFIRWREGRPLFIGDKCHFSHRLLDLGMSHRGTVIFIYLVNICIGLAATLLPYVSIFGNILIILQVIIIYVLITILIAMGRRNRR